MKVSSILGIVFIALGVIGLTIGGIRYTSNQSQARIGPIEITAKEHKEIPIPPIAGAISLLAGVVILAVGRRQGS